MDTDFAKERRRILLAIAATASEAVPVATLVTDPVGSVIDSLEMLASKTRGNLTVSEEKLLATALQNLKPLYQAAQAS